MAAGKRPAGMPGPKRRPRIAGTSGRPDQTDRVFAPQRVALVAAGGGPSLRRPPLRSGAPASRRRYPRPRLVRWQLRWPRPLAGLGWRPVAWMALLAVILALFAAVAAWRPGARVSNAAFVDNAATAEVKAAAADSLRTILGTDFAKIDQWPAAVRAKLTGRMQASFDKTSAVTVEAVKRARTRQDVQVNMVAVSMLEERLAEVAAVVTLSATGEDGTAGQSQRGGQRLRLEKVDGRWLLADVYEDCYRKGALSQDCGQPR